jgi:hypothetical protein
MKCDGHIGGETFLCEVDVFLLQQVSKNNNYVTTLGLTLLSQEPLIFVTIFTGKRADKTVELNVGEHLLKKWVR